MLCYQSRVGPQKWLQPSLTGTIERMAQEGIKRMLVIPIAFLTEHIETLHEINIEAREEAESLGVTEFDMMPALNDSPLLIRALADLVLRSVGMRSGVASLHVSRHAPHQPQFSTAGEMLTESFVRECLDTPSPKSYNPLFSLSP